MLQRDESYYEKTIEETYALLATSSHGLTFVQVKERITAYGFNELKEKKKLNILLLFFRQFHSILIYILLCAVLISLFLGEYVDAIVILVILLFNALFGVVQEYKAEKSIAALKKLTSLKATVLRDSVVQKIDAKELVPGDILLLEEGDHIPADGRIIETVHLQTNEASITGESMPVEKETRTLGEKSLLPDQKNMVFAGTIVASGRGKAIITATGMNRQIGKIAELIEEAQTSETPLQHKLDKLGKWLGIGTIIICFVVFLMTIFKGMHYLPAFLAAVALAVAAVPEGLPAVVTISLALGVQRMIKQNALIRKLSSVETLGCTTVICADKTGTLTKNEMTVRRIYANKTVIEVTGTGYSPEGDFYVDGTKIAPKEIQTLLKIGVLNNNAHIENGKVLGDPTEGCLLISAEKAGMKRGEIEVQEQRIDEIIFDSTRKRMSTVHRVVEKRFLYCKGAPESVLRCCTKLFLNGKEKNLSEAEKKKILEVNHQFAATALRVLAFAYKELPEEHTKKEKHYTYSPDDEKELVFVGLQGMIDPPRQEARASIEKCKAAGIRVIMITGDHATTAKAIGEELGIGTQVMDGEELAKQENLKDVVEKINIFARVDPVHKLKIVDALQARGHVVAMTGDGVNDAPALKKADIGIAMGITGTDVSKEASVMVLTDDNFRSIVNAVEEGRGIYGNIKKYFSFLLSGNIAEVLIVFFITLFGFPLPLVAAQILLINLVTDGFPALALGVDPYEPRAMEQKPRKKEEPIYAGLVPFLVIYPFIMTVIVITIFLYIFLAEGNIVKAQTMTFATIALFELFQAFACRSTVESSWKAGLFKNPWLLIAVGLSASILLAVIYVPFLQQFFGTIGISWMEFFTLVVLASLGALSIEISKWVQREVRMS